MLLHIVCVNVECRKSLQIDESLAGKPVRCSACGQVMVAPSPVNDEPHVPVAQMAAELPPINSPVTATPSTTPPRPEATPVAAGLPPQQPLSSDEYEVIAIDPVVTAAAAKRCPKCDAAWPADAVLCINCGYDFRTGRKRLVVKTREVRRTFRLNAFRHVAVVILALGGLFLFFALLGVMLGNRPLLAVLCLLPSLAAVVAGVFLLIACRVKVRVYQHREGYLVCAFQYLLGNVPYWRNEKYVLPGDKFVITHETHPLGIIIMLFLLLCLVVPGILWWWLLLKQRTKLTIQNDATGRRQGFSLFWDDDAIRDLIKVVHEVEHIELVRR